MVSHEVQPPPFLQFKKHGRPYMTAYMMYYKEESKWHFQYLWLELGKDPFATKSGPLAQQKDLRLYFNGKSYLFWQIA